MRKLSDKQWSIIEPMLPRQNFVRGGRPRKNDRQIFEAIRWILTTGAQWNELPVKYGSGKTAWKRFTAWKRTGVWKISGRNFSLSLIERISLPGKLPIWMEHLLQLKRGQKVDETKRGKRNKDHVGS